MMNEKPTYRELEEKVKILNSRDITGRKEATLALQQSEERYRRIIEDSGAGYFFLDLDGRFQRVNSAWLHMHKYETDEEIIGHHYSLTQVEGNLPDAQKNVEQLLSGKLIPAGEFSRRCKDGSIKWHKFTAKPVKENEKIIGLEGFLIDITDCNRVEKALKESEERYRTIFMNSPVGIFRSTFEGRFLDVNPSLADILGYDSPEDVIKSINSISEQIYVSDEKRQEIVSDQMQSMDVTRHLNRYRRKDGTEFIANLYLKTVRDVEGKPVFLEGIVENITERKQAEDALKESEERFRTLFNNTSEGILVAELKSKKFHLANPAICQMLGYSEDELIGMNVKDIHPEESLDHVISEFEAQARGERVLAPSIPCRQKDGKIIYADVNTRKAKIHGIEYNIGLFTDITERKQAEAEREKLEAELNKAQKMEAIVTMAGGIAHDFNNLLSVILGNIDMAEEDAAPGSPQAKALNSAIRATQRAASLTEKFITFSSGGSPVKNSISLQEFLKDTVNIALSGSNIQCDFSIDQDLQMVEIDQDQMGQAIGNIITNAKEAMPRGGTILLRACNMSDEQMAYEAGIKLQDDFFIKITVEDQGEGIPQKNLTKIFDPYFSTKERGVQKGMGLGLTIASSIIRNHGGHIQVESEEAKGTTVSIYLPVLHQNETVVCPSTDKLVDSPPKAREKKTTKILIMDDEEMLRDMAQDLLGRLGYEQVAVATNGEDALSMYTQARGQGEPFDLLLLDLTIKGGMGGEETIQRLHEINPEVRAIVCSGYSDDPVVTNYAAYGFIGALAKPFSREKLNNAIIQALYKK